MRKAKPRFDPEKLMSLVDPIQVFLERVQNDGPETISLPALDPATRQIDQRGSLGMGWTKDDIIKLPAWLAAVWSGAGYYEVTLMDARGQKMEYCFHVSMTADVKVRPVPQLGANIVPPGAVQQAPQAQTQAIVQPTPPPQPSPAYVPLAGAAPPPQPQWGPQMMMPTPNTPPPPQPGASPPLGWSSPPPVTQGQPQAQQPQQPYPYYQQQQQPQQFFGYQGWPPVAPTRDEKAEERMRALEAQLEESKRAALQAQYQQELERQRMESQRELASIKEEMRRLGETKNQTGNDEARREREERERIERERERERNDQRFADLNKAIAEIGKSHRPEEDDRIRRLEDESRRRDEEHKRELEKRDQQMREDRMRQEMKEQTQRTEQMMRDLKDEQRKGPDPVIEMMKENQRMQIAMQQEVARMQAASVQAMQQNSINPIQLMSILEKRDSTSDQFTRTLLPTLTGVIDLYRGAAQNVVELAGGGSAATWQPVAQEAMATGKEIMDRYFTWKRDAAVSENKAKQAQAEAASAAARAHAAVTGQRAAPPQPPPQFVTNSGHVGPANGQAAGPQPQAQQTAPMPPPAAVADAQVIPIKRPPSEEEQFGPALESVKRLRLGVKDGTLDPKKAVDAILRGVSVLAQRGLIVPAFTLYQEERWADFIDVLLPQAPAPFREECVRILSEETEVVGRGSQNPTDPDLQA
jgi:hypothetical protein